MSNSILITDSLGNLIEQNSENFQKLGKLKDIGCVLDKEGKKLENMKIMHDRVFILTRSENHVSIIVHSHGNRKGDSRPNRFYFFYITDESNDIRNILNSFFLASHEEAKKYNIEIMNVYESLYIFRDIEKVINNESKIIDDKLAEFVPYLYSTNIQPRVETKNIESAIRFLVESYNKIDSDKIAYTLYSNPDPIGHSKEKTIEIVINTKLNSNIRIDETLKKSIIENRTTLEKNNVINLFGQIREKIDILKKFGDPTDFVNDEITKVVNMDEIRKKSKDSVTRNNDRLYEEDDDNRNIKTIFTYIIIFALGLSAGILVENYHVSQWLYPSITPVVDISKPTPIVTKTPVTAANISTANISAVNISTANITAK